MIEPRERSPRIDPYWYGRVLEGIPPHDRAQIERVRNVVNSDSQQWWYYGGAAHDVTPLVFAPTDTQHWFVDGDTYSFELIRDVIVGQMTLPLLKTRAEVKVGPFVDPVGSDDTVNGTIQVGNSTIHLVTADVHKPHILPDAQIDAVYANSFSPSAITYSLMNLKIGGLYVVAEDVEATEGTDPEYINRNTYGPNKLLLVEGSPFSQVEVTEPFVIHFPLFGDLGVTTEGRTNRVRVLRKEKDIDRNFGAKINPKYYLLK